MPGQRTRGYQLLRGVLHAGDDDLDGDGIPDLFGTYGIYYTTIEAVGVDRLASAYFGATPVATSNSPLASK